MTFGSLFAGIGGFDLGLQREGLRCAWQVKRDPACRRLLAAKFPHAAQHDDVRTVGAHNLAPAIAFSSKDHGAYTGELAPTLRAMSQVAIAQTLTAEMYRSGGATAGNNPGVRNVLLPNVRRLMPRECERLQGFPDDWTDGFADSVRYRMLGNAVAVPCAEWIGRRLVRYFGRTA